MIAVAPLLLARAMQAARAGATFAPVLSSPLGPAQAGAALRLMSSGHVQVSGAAEAAVSGVHEWVRTAFAPGTLGAALIGNSAAGLDVLERAAAPWFVNHPVRPAAAAAAGYWLADTFLRGTTPPEAVTLARFLVGATAIPVPAGRATSVRRYPTGGLSEKQALLLPPLLRAAADALGWCSPFLVARRLAHTGGTLDKLSILKGFAPAPAASLSSWNGRGPPVLYVAAGDELCPRDAAMYRMRGETGTVADQGLMAASIMSKQAAAPVDGLVLDILYGPTAFLPDQEAARGFGRLCAGVGEQLGIAVTPAYRRAGAPFGRSLGASTEVVEAVELLRPSAAVHPPEIARALDFVERMAGAAGLDGALARGEAERALRSGCAQQQLAELWQDHGVDSAFARRVISNPRKALLGELTATTLYARQDGVASFDWIALASAVNSGINGFRAIGEGLPALNPGGVEVHVAGGQRVSRGDVLLTAYALRDGPPLEEMLAETVTYGAALLT